MFLLLTAFVLSGCDSSGSSVETADCASRTGNSMTATVNGDALCTDLGSALLVGVSGSRLSVLGFGTWGSVVFSVENPRVGTFDLADPDAENDAMYGMPNETAYYVDRDEGSGSVTIVDLTDSRVRGTFAFTGVGYDVNLNPTGDQAEVTDGTFDVALASDI